MVNQKQKTKSRRSRILVWCWRSFCVVFSLEKKTIRDLIIFIFLAVSLAGFLGVNWYRLNQKAKEGEKLSAKKIWNLSEADSIKRNQEEIINIQIGTDTSSWRTYQNTWYGFVLRYPTDWSDPVAKSASPGVNWEQKVEFRWKEASSENPFEGFDVFSYNISKAKDLTVTDEFPKLKNAELKDDEACASIEGHLLETGDYSAEEIYVPISDPCYNAALFFTNTRDNYIYTIVPKIKDGWGLSGDPAGEIVNHFPDFFAIISTWNIMDIQRPKAVAKRPVIVAPMPFAFNRSGGRLVCNKKNDHPGKSKQGKGRHLDMECCLDPDEYPNPHCYYPESKYGKYL